MKKHFLLIPALVSAFFILHSSLLATPVFFSLKQITGSPRADRFTITADAAGNPLTDGTSLIGGFAFTTNAPGGTNTINLQPNGYTLSVPGWARTLHFNVPDTNVVLNVVNLITNGLASYSPVTIGGWATNINNASGTNVNLIVTGGNVITNAPNGSVAWGDTTVASGANSHAEGSTTTAAANQSHAEGSGTLSSGIASHAEGSGTTASMTFAHAEGDGTTASGYASHSEGQNTVASGAAAHADGNSTTASGGQSHAEGEGTLASGTASHAEGSYTTASGRYSHAAGENAAATNINSFVWSSGAAQGSDSNGTFTVSASAIRLLSGPTRVTTLNLSGTTNQVIFGATNTPPVSTNLVRWISVQIVGDTNQWRLGLAK